MGIMRAAPGWRSAIQEVFVRLAGLGDRDQKLALQAVDHGQQPSLTVRPLALQERGERRRRL